MRATIIRAACAMLAFCDSIGAQNFRPDIPKAWDDAGVARFETPLAQRDRSPRYLSAKDYYAFKVRPIYRSYPMYAPGREPAGYIESLKQKDPEIIFDPSKLQTKNDWIQAGKLVFESEILFRLAPATPQVNPDYPPSSDGIIPNFLARSRYYIRTRGVLEVGINSCSGCHTRVLPDGSLLEGAQGEVEIPTSAAALGRLRDLSPDAFQRRLDDAWLNYGAPWIISKDEFQRTLTRDELIRRQAAHHRGVFPRQGTSQTHAPHVASLIGIQDIKYLDSTGLVHHRGIADLMRYAIINEGLDTIAHFGDFQPTTSQGASGLGGEDGTRYSDEQLYAMALYLYSLMPPPNPNPVDESARRGQQIFQQQGCAGCHTPPLYTNNKLTPAKGFKVPADLLKTEDVLNVSVGTDPTLALQTRRGTGFYKVPSLRGVWYRNAFGHGGWADTLEEWFDPARLRNDYVPQGFHMGPGAIQGHEFGLKLAPEDKQALVAFLKTL